MNNRLSGGNIRGQTRNSLISSSNSHFSRNVSIQSESGGDQLKLYKRLNEITEEGFGFNIYQNDYQKFESQVSENSSNSNQILIPKKKRSYMRGVSRMDSIRHHKKKKRYKRKVFKTRNKINNVFKRRKICRLISLCGILTFIAIIVTVFYLLGVRGDDFQKSVLNSKKFDISIENCRLFMRRGRSSSNLDFELRQRIALADIFQPSNYEAKIIEDTSQKFSYLLKQRAGGIRDCNLYISLPATTPISLLNITCLEDCVIIQEGSVQLQDLTISGENVHSNFESIEILGTLQASFLVGFLQLNDVVFQAGSSHNVQIVHGDLIIQTRETIDVNYLTSCNNYCLSATSYSALVPVVQSPIGNRLLPFKINSHYKRNLFESEWAGKTRLCGSTCGSNPIQIETVNFEGNIYVNVIEELPGLPLNTTNNIFQSDTYGKLLNFSDFSFRGMQDMIRSTQVKSLPNLVVKLLIGNYNAWAAQSQTWVYTDHNLFPILKPWWLSVFTLAKLVENSRTINTFLTPGICPFTHSFTPQQNYLIRQLISESLSSNGAVSYVVPVSSTPYIDQSPKPTKGFKSFSTSPNFSDEWIDISVDNGFKVVYKNQRITENVPIFYLMVISIIIALIVALYMSLHLFGFMFSVQEYITYKILLIQFYWKVSKNLYLTNSGIQEAILEEEEQDRHLEQSKFLRTLRNLNLLSISSIMAFMDFFISEMLRSRTVTLRSFNRLLFEEAVPDEVQENEIQQSNKEKISLKKLKSIFQQYCLMNNYRECDLSEEFAKRQIKHHGFMISTSEKHSNFYLTRIVSKRKGENPINVTEISEKENSLKLFIQHNWQRTEFDEDKIQFDYFLNQYDVFCKMHHFEKSLIDHIVLKNEFSISSKRIAKEIVERDLDYQPTILSNTFSYFSGFWRQIRRMFRAKYFKMDYTRVEGVSKFLSGKLSRQENEMQSWAILVKLSTLPPFWWLHDFLSIFLQLVINGTITISFLMIFIFQEIQHSYYSTRQESINLQSINWTSTGIWLLPQKIWGNLLLSVFTVLFVLFWISALLTMIFDIIFMKFPWIKAFSNPHANSFSNYLRAYQWMFVFVACYAIMAYVTTVVIWDILAALIKPDAYIVSTSMAVSLVYLVFMLYNQFKRLSVASETEFNKIYREMWKDRIRLIAKKILKSEKGYHEDGQSVSKQFLAFQEKLATAKASMKRLEIDQPSSIPFINFFFAYLEGTQPRLREAMEVFCQSPQMNLNSYWTELIGNVMFESIGFKNDRFSIQKNIRLCASLVLSSAPQELMSLTLKDLDEQYRMCDCDEDTPIFKDKGCENCYNLGLGHRYQRKDVQESIKRSKIMTNSKLIVDLLQILSHLQKRNTDEVIEIINKIFVEAYSAKVFERVKPICDLINLIIFNLDDKFDYNQLIEIFLNFLKKSMKVEMKLAEILMIYLLKDEILSSSDRGEAHDSKSITNLFKRQICSVQENSRESKMLVKYLSLASTFYSRETYIHSNLLNELTQVVNQNTASNQKVPSILVEVILQTPLYLRQQPEETLKHINHHARDYRIKPDISNMFVYFELISRGVEVDGASYLDTRQLLKNCTSFEQIKNYFSMGRKELLGVIYLMKGRVQNPNLHKVINLMLRKNKLLDYRSVVEDIITMITADDPMKFKKSVLVFCRFLKPQTQTLNRFVKIFAYLKGFINQSDSLALEIVKVYETFPFQRLDNNQRFKQEVKDSIIKRDYIKFKIIRDNLLAALRRKNTDKKLDDESLNTFYIVDFFFALNFESNKVEVLQKLKRFYIELENQQFSNFMLLLLKTIQGFSNERSDIINEKIHYSFTLLGELIIERPSSLEKLWNIAYSHDYSKKVDGLKYFLGEELFEKVNLKKRLKCHMMFVAKYIEFVYIQEKFIRRFSEELHGEKENEAIVLGITCLKVCVLKNRTFDKVCIQDIVITLFQKMKVAINPHNKNQATSIEDVKIFNVFVNLFSYIISRDGHSLAKLYQDDNENMMSCLIRCLDEQSVSMRLNNILTELFVNNGNKQLAAIYYFYFLLIGKVKRHKQSMKTELETTVNQWISIKPQFMEFLDLYVYRSPVDLVEKIYKIQNRMLLNSKSSEELVMLGRRTNDIISQDMIRNICMIIDHQVPYLKDFASTFKVPHDRLSFIYILNCLKKDHDFDKNLELLKINKEILNLMASLGIHSEELCFLLKVCLNKMDYDSITEFLKLLKLDKIIPEILFNLLLIDMPIGKKMISLRDFNKEFLVHSSIFEKLNVSRELTWAFFRVLKGDFITFKEMLGTLYDDSVPINHKYFMNILVGFVGLKNVKFTYEDIAIDWEIGMQEYASKIRLKFDKYDSDHKEISLEYALFLLNKHFKFNPLWFPAVANLDDSQQDMGDMPGSMHRQSSSVDDDSYYEPSDVDSLDDESSEAEFNIGVTVEESSGESQSTFVKKQFTLMQIFVLHTLMTAEETVLLFLYDFAMFIRINKFLNNDSVSGEIAIKQFYQKNIEELRKFFGEKEEEYRAVLRKLLFYKVIPLHYKAVLQDKYKHTAAYKNMELFFEAEKQIKQSEGLYTGGPLDQDAIFNEKFNRVVLKIWQEDLNYFDEEGKDLKKIHIKDSEKYEDLMDKLKQTIADEDNQLGSKPIFDFFVVKENLMMKTFWERKFNEEEYLDSFEDSLINHFLEQFNEVQNILDKAFRGEDDLLHGLTSNSTSYSFLNEHRKLSQVRRAFAASVNLNHRKLPRHSLGNILDPEPKQIPNDLKVKWSGGLLQSLLLRMRGYISLSSDEKTEKLDEIMFKSDLLFNILEKTLYMDASDVNSSSFRKFSYLIDFNLSNGIIMIPKSFVKSSASLFLPELTQYTSDLMRQAKYMESSEYKGEGQEEPLSKENSQSSPQNSDNAGFEQNGQSNGNVNISGVDRLFMKCKILQLIFQNDAKHFPMSGNFKQFCFVRDYDDNPVVEQKFNLRVFQSQVQCLKNILNLKVKEDTKKLAAQYYIPIFALKKEFQENKEARSQVIRDVFKKHLMQSKSGRESVDGSGSTDIDMKADRVPDPTLISMMFLEQQVLYDIKVSPALIKDLFNSYYSKNLDTYKKKKGSKIKAYYYQILQNFKFLNDLALGKYTVLSETKNLFSDDYSLTNYQKIYESILSLHTAKKRFRKQLLVNALRDLARNLKSNVNKLGCILEFVMNDDVQYNFTLFKLLDISNYTFYHIFNLHSYDSNQRMLRIQQIVKEYFLVPEGVKGHIENLINLIYIVKLNKGDYMSRYQFKQIAMGIIVQVDTRENQYGPLIKVIYDIIHHGEANKRPKINHDKSIKKLYREFNKIDGRKVPEISKTVLKQANKFMLHVYDKTLLSYFSKIDLKKQDRLIRDILGVNQLSNLKLFKIIDWIKGNRDLTEDEIEQTMEEHFLQGILKEYKDGDTFSRVKNIVRFLKAFYCRDIGSLLDYMHDQSMQAEYSYLFSSYIYVSIINGWVPELDKIQEDSEKSQYMAMVLCYPLLQLIITSLKKKSSREREQNEMMNFLEKVLQTQKDIIFQRREGGILEMVQKRNRSSDDTLDKLMRGELFEPVLNDIYNHTEEMIGGNRDEVYLSIFQKLVDLYFFSNRFYENMDQDSNQNLKALMRSSIQLREKWKEMSKRFSNKAKKNSLLNIDAYDLIKSIMDQCQILDFRFLNVRGKQNRKSLKTVIFPMMMMVFLYIDKVREQIKKDDNASRLYLLQVCLNFVWRLCHECKENPIKALKLGQKKEVSFINKYTWMMHFLRIRRSNSFLLSELLRFMKDFIFERNDRPQNGENGTEKRSYNSDKMINDLLTSLRLESFMELYDYMEDMITGQKYSENNKENIINLLLIQIESVNPDFSRKVPDIKNLIKLLQVEWDRMDYFINKIFLRDDNVSFASNIFKNLYQEKLELGDEAKINNVGKKLGEPGFVRVDRNKLLKRAEEGHASYKDLLLILEKDAENHTTISFLTLKKIFRRLGLNLTGHRIAELIAAAKIRRLNNSVGTANLNMTNIHMSEFQYILDAMQQKIYDETNETLSIAPRNLFNFSLASALIFLFNINYISNIVGNVFGGGIIAASLCALIPLCTVIIIASYKRVSILEKETLRIVIEDSFKIVTNSKPEFLP